MRQAEIGRKKFYARIPSILDLGKKIPKKIAKKFKNLKKTSFRHYIQPKRDEIGRELRKKFQSRIPFILDPGKKIPKKIAKKFKNHKKPLFGIIFSQNGMRQAEKARKKFQTRIPFILDPGKKIPKRDEIGREREKKILGPNSADTGPRQENSEKISKEIQKIKKPISGNISSQNGMRQAEKERKKIQSQIPFILVPTQKIPKKVAKKFKKLKKFIPALFLSKTG